MKKLLTAAEVADMLSVDPATVYRWAESGHLPAYRLGPGTLRFDPDAVDAWLSGQSVGSPSRRMPEVQPSSSRVSRLRAAISQEVQAKARVPA